MIQTKPGNVVSHRLSSLAGKLGDEEYRHSYLAHRAKVSLASQIRALRGSRTQAKFGRDIGMPQSVVSRLEDENYGNVSLNTLIGIAQKLDIALVMQFVDYPTFLAFTDDQSERAMSPEPFDASAVDAFVQNGADHRFTGRVVQENQPSARGSFSASAYEISVRDRQLARFAANDSRASYSTRA